MLSLILLKMAHLVAAAAANPRILLINELAHGAKSGFYRGKLSTLVNCTLEYSNRTS